ncbi:MAG: hypothetical protein M1834_003149 [Cirrosporium novae-zelandiae]|nr:MAG: hypothetical protein M1834_003149 [Cirrosporium novae-zelandiae]
MANTIRSALTGFRTSPLWKSLTGLIKALCTKPATSCLQYQEEPDLYGPGGFYRVSLGDEFDNRRYTVLRKIGYGQYSTVWLARDSKSDCYDGNRDMFEIEMLEAISRISESSTHPGRKSVVQLLDHFHHIRPNGNHICLVFNALGHHLGFQAAKFKQSRISVRVMKEVAKQLLLGLDFLHRECDLKPSNILLKLENVEEVITKYLSKTSPRLLPEPDKKLDTPNTHTTGSPAVVPLREIITTPLITKIEKIHIRIIDFGVSSWVDRHLSDRIQSPFLRAPEVTLGAPWSTGVDIWSLGCLMIELVKGHYAFPGNAAKNGAWTADDDRLAQLMETIRNLLHIPQLNPASLESLMDGDDEVLRRPEDMPQTEVPVLTS